MLVRRPGGQPHVRHREMNTDFELGMVGWCSSPNGRKRRKKARGRESKRRYKKGRRKRRRRMRSTGPYGKRRRKTGDCRGWHKLKWSALVKEEVRRRGGGGGLLSVVMGGCWGALAV